MMNVVSVATLYEDAQQKMADAISVSRSVFESLEETLSSMEPMVRAIDQTDPKVIELLGELKRCLADSGSLVTLRSPDSRKRRKRINEKLSRSLRVYVQQSLSQIDHEVGVADPTDQLGQLLNPVMGMLVNERHRAAESTKFVFKILDLTLEALRRQWDAGQLENPAWHLPLMKKVEFLVRFHRGRYSIDIPDALTELARQMRRLFPEQVRLALEHEIQELQEKDDREREERVKKQQLEKLIMVICVIIVLMFSNTPSGSIKKFIAEEGKAILSFIVPILIIIIAIAYVWYCYTWIASEPPPPEPFDHVFLSCRGDILETHAEPLNKALQEAQLRTFYYGERKNPGLDIEEKLRVGINRSASAIILFSKEFAKSNWCLNEVALIIGRNNNRENPYPFFPIYCDGACHMDLTFKDETRTSIYHESLENHKYIYGEAKVEEWKNALNAVGGREGMRAIGSESELKTFFKQVAEEIKTEIARLRR